MKCLGGHYQVEFWRIILTVFESFRREGYPRVSLQITCGNCRQVPARFDAMDQIAAPCKQSGGFPCTTTDLQDPPAFW